MSLRRTNLLLFLLVGCLLAVTEFGQQHQAGPPAFPREQLAALEETISGSSEEELFYKLPDLAKRAFNAGEVGKAMDYSRRLLQTASQ